MRADLECPYCDAELDVDTDDGDVYEEGILHEMQCEHCEKYFTFTTHVSFYYSPEKADCLNGSEHRLRASKTFPVEFTEIRCQDCSYSRQPTEGEMSQIINLGGLLNYPEDLLKYAKK